MIRNLRLLMAALIAVVILAACGEATPTGTTARATATTGQAAAATGTSGTAATARAGASERVRLALDWTPNTNHTGFYAAQARGWYREEGVELEILPYSEANTPDALVGAGQADLGISFTEALVVDYVAGLPVKSVGTIAQHNTSALVTLKSSGIDSPAQLAGKRYAGFGAPFEEPVIAAMIGCEGGADTGFQNITANVFGYQALVAGQADFVWIFMGWEGIQAQRDGVDLNVFYVREHCVPDYYTPLIIANTDWLSKNADLAKRVMRATARGYQLAVENPSEAARLLIEANPPGTFPDADLVQESARFLAPVFKGEVPRWGEQSLQMFTDYPKFMIESGRLLDSNGRPYTGDIVYEDLFTNEFLP